MNKQPKMPFTITSSRYDRTNLKGMIEEAILDCMEENLRLPYKEEVFDRLFSKSRNDPEAEELVRKLDRLVESLLS